MPVKDQEIETITIRIKAATEKELARQRRVIHSILARTSLNTIASRHYTKEKCLFRFRTKITASGTMPQIMHCVEEIVRLECSWANG